MRAITFVLLALALSATSAAAGQNWKLLHDVDPMTDAATVAAGVMAPDQRGHVLFLCIMPRDGEPYYVARTKVNGGIYRFNGTGKVDLSWRTDQHGVFEEQWKYLDGALEVYTTGQDAMSITTAAYESRYRLVIGTKNGVHEFQTGSEARKAIGEVMRRCGDEDLLYDN